MSIYCPRCYSNNVSRIQQSASPGIGSQLGMAALGTQLARHLPLPSPFGQLAGGLIGSILGQAIDPPSRQASMILHCNDCHYQFS
ncbi:hypothetical protein [Alkanindiges illinoisensis]|uniref:Uncharacterized protein n=1 Tax=Alkanindiges illinoisensis TaxID=197183 RepID=A0A4Y7XD33_9GAMM|nr:hypothetical protein [Alkanindiges illinoisensis]TEU28525.1 hypothetical protein E2B99_05920 [Alkanindiges illinoisensis]